MSGESEGGGQSEKNLGEITQEKIEEGIEVAEDWANYSKDPQIRSPKKINRLTKKDVDVAIMGLEKSYLMPAKEPPAIQQAFPFDFDAALNETKKIKQKLLKDAERQKKELEAAKDEGKEGEESVAAEAVRITKESANDHIERVTRFPDHKPPSPELPDEVIVNLEKVIGEVVNSWGENPREIKENMKKAGDAEVFGSLIDILDAQILDAYMRDEKFRNDPEVQKLKTLAESSYLLLTDPSLHHKVDAEDHAPIVELKVEEVDGKLVARRAKRKDKYYSFSLSDTGDAFAFINLFKADIGKLKLAKEAAKSQALRSTLDFSPDLGDPHLDNRVEELNNYLYEMIMAFENSKIALNDPEKRNNLKTKSIRELKKAAKSKGKDMADEEAEKLAEEAISDSFKVIGIMQAYFEGLNRRDPKWIEEEKEKSAI